MEQARNIVFVAILILFLPLLLAWAVVYIPFFLIWGAVLRIWFWRVHASRGRFILFVYSDSPNWQSYVEANILPQIRHHAVILNWSERRNWSETHPWEERFFQRFAGNREFNPVALVFGPRARVKKVRFYRAFLDYKHGNPTPLQRAESELLELARVSA